MTTTPQTKTRHLIYDVEEISYQLIENIRDVIDALEITSKYEIYRDRVVMPCPVHGGDNPQGFSILLSGVGNWQCYTHQCHVEYGNSRGASIISLIQAYKKYTFKQALHWSANFLGISGKREEEIEFNREKSTFIQLCRTLKKEESVVERKLLPRSRVRDLLVIPAENFVKIGYSPIVLDRYDIGLCNTPNRPMTNRVVVPLYDETGQYMLGCSGRTIFDKCTKCNLYHEINSSCPITQLAQLNSVKWRVSGEFGAESYLYNLWSAKKYIEDSKTVILVEGPGDVLKLEEAGIKNSLALLGVKFTPLQKQKIEQLGATNLIIGTDNDEAGNKARIFIRNECKRLFNVYDVVAKGKDFGEMKIEDIRSLFNDKNFSVCW